MQINLTKCHGSGNDFLLIDEISNNYIFTEKDREKLAILLCDRNTDLGADGILFVMKSSHQDVKGRMRVFNADGSEASMCGNGLRIVARYICEMFGLEESIIETMKADLKVSKQLELYPDVSTYQVEISPVSFELKDLPLMLNQPKLINGKIEELNDKLTFSAVAVPNPHLISIVTSEQLETDLQRGISEKVNGPNDLFPDGVNVSFVKLLSKGHIYVRTYERGVGFTNACGTAMSASSLITCLDGQNEFEKAIHVYNNGGKVKCIVHKIGNAFYIDLIGNATYLYEASLTVNPGFEEFTLDSKHEFKEQQAYEKLQAEAQEFIKTAKKG